MFDFLGTLLLDDDRAGAEVRVVVVGDLADDRLDRLGFDPGLRRVVHAAGKIAVGRDLDGRCDEASQHELVLSVAGRGGVYR